MKRIQLSDIRSDLTDMSNNVVRHANNLAVRGASDVRPGTDVEALFADLKALEAQIDALRQKLYNAQI